jgi:hypothetical protein
MAAPTEATRWLLLVPSSSALDTTASEETRHGERHQSPLLLRPEECTLPGECERLRFGRALDVEALVKRVQEEFVERVKTIEGFVGYYVIDGGDGTVTSITLAETEEAVEASTVQTQHWVVEKAAHLVEGAPT